MKYLIVTFESTTDAILFARAAEAKKMDGGLGLVPRALQASCGLAWWGSASEERALRRFLRANALNTKGIVIWEAA